MTSTSVHARRNILSFVALLILAANLRPALTTVGPLVSSIQDATGLSAAAVGLLSSLPLLALAAFAPIGNFVRRIGLERILAVSLVVLFVGILLRSSGSTFALFAGTLVLAAGIAVGNVLGPSLIKRDYPERVGTVTTIYVLVLALTAAVATGLSVPFEKWLPGGWRSSLAIWAIPAGLAALLWLFMARPSPETPQALSQSGASTVWRSPLAWSVAVFMGLQSIGFYVVVSWFPKIINDYGYDLTVAAFMVTCFQLISVASGAALPKFLALRDDQRALAVICSLCIATGAFGMLLYPAWTIAWVLIAGFGTGVCFPLSIAFIGLRSGDHHQAAALSVMAQSMGYLLAASGPVLFGLARDLSGGWSVPLAAFGFVAVAQAIIGYVAGQNRTISTSHS